MKNTSIIPSPVISRATLLATSLGLAIASQAADQTWIDTNTNADWNTTAGVNWDTGVAWTQNNSAIFGGTGETVTLTEAINAGGLTFNAADYIISGSTLSLANGCVVHTGEHAAAIHSALSGSFVKAGTGTLSLGSGANAAYAGTVTIRNGILNLTNANTLGTGANANIVLGDASTAPEDIMELQVSASWGSTGTITVNNFGAEAIINFPTSGDVNLNGLGLTMNLLRTTTFKGVGSGANVKDLDAYITGGAGMGNDTVVADSGSGNVVRNTGIVGKPADYTGNLHVKSGTFTTQSRTFLANTPENRNLAIPDQATVIVDSGATWSHTWGDEIIGFIAGGGTSAYNNNGTTTTLTLAGNSGTATTDGLSGSATFSGVINGLATKIVKDGSGTQEFSGAFTMNGKPIDLNNGTLKLTNITSTFKSTGAINVGGSTRRPSS